MHRFLPTPKPKPHHEPVKMVESTFPGTVSNDFHEQYTQYNSYIAQLETQKERGWKVLDGWVEKPIVGKPALFRIQVVDKGQKPVSGGLVHISFLRASDKNMDVAFDLPETAPGFYGMPLSLSAPGSWSIMISIRRGAELHEVQGATQVGTAPPQP
jgi:nitrogen fixation protein FixH